MSAPRAPRPATAHVRRTTFLAGAVAWFSLATATAWAHGGSTIVDGGRDGVSVLVRGAAAQTAGGAPAVDISTIVNGPGTGEQATIDYWVRPAGGKTFKVQPERDAGGTFHADIATAGRGDWTTWDLSAVVTLAGGERLRVTNDSGDAPGPALQAAPQEPASGSRPAPTQPTLSEGPSTPAEPLPREPAADAAPIDDISDESNGPPAWVFPSLLVLVVIGLAVLAVQRRRPGGTPGD